MHVISGRKVELCVGSTSGDGVCLKIIYSGCWLQEKQGRKCLFFYKVSLRRRLIV